MKTSTKVLLGGALAVPLLAMIGVGMVTAPMAEAVKGVVPGMGRKEGKVSLDVDLSSRDENGSRRLEDYPAVVIASELVDVGPDFSVNLHGVVGDISFDDKLAGKARVDLRCERELAFRQKLTREKIDLVPDVEGKKAEPAVRCLAKISLPETFDALDVDCSSSSCFVVSQRALKFKKLRIGNVVGRMSATFAELTLDELSVHQGAGKSDIELSRLRIGKRLGVKSEAGNSSFGVLALESTSADRPVELKFENAAGSLGVRLESIQGYAIAAENAAGKLEVRDGGRTILESKGLGDSHKQGDKNAPFQMKLGNAAGKLDVELN